MLEHGVEVVDDDPIILHLVPQRLRAFDGSVEQREPSKRWGRVEEAPHHAARHLAGPENHDVGSGQFTAQLVDGRRGRRLGEACGPPRDSRLGAHAPSRGDRPLEEVGHLAAGTLLLDGEFEGPAQLAEDLELAGHDGLQPGRDAEEMGRDVVLEVDRQPVLKFDEGQARSLGQDLGDLGHRVVEPVNYRDDLGAKTGGDENRLVNVAMAHERAQHLRPLVLGHRRALQEIEGGVLVVDADRDQRHGASGVVTATRASDSSSRCRASAALPRPRVPSR